MLLSKLLLVLSVCGRHLKKSRLSIFFRVYFWKKPHDALSAEAFGQIQHYLTRPGIRLNLPVDVDGTVIHRKIWMELMAISCWEVKTCGELGSILHFSPEVISDACEANPLALYIPSHRAIAISSPKGPVGEGDPSHPLVQTKFWLLKHEGFLHA